MTSHWSKARDRATLRAFASRVFNIVLYLLGHQGVSETHAEVAQYSTIVSGRIS